MNSLDVSIASLVLQFVKFKRLLFYISIRETILYFWKGKINKITERQNVKQKLQLGTIVF